MWVWIDMCVEGLVWNVWDGYIGYQVDKEGLGLVWRV